MVKNKYPQKRNGEGKCDRIWKKECITIKLQENVKLLKIFLFS